MEHEASAQSELKGYLMQDPDYRRLAELQLMVSQHLGTIIALDLL